MQFEDYEEIVCPDCGNDALTPSFKLLRLSALNSKDGKESRKAVPTYACANCLKELPLIPMEIGDHEIAKCSCEKDIFCCYHKVIKISALKSKSGKEEYSAIPLYSCLHCTSIYNLVEDK